MKKKILSMLVALGMVASIAVSASAYETQVNYSTTAAGQTLDIDNDGNVDMTCTDTVTFGIKVPASINVNNAVATDKAWIAGLTDGSVTLTVPNKVNMKDAKNNALDANFAMGTDNTLKLNTSITAIGRVSAPVSANWTNAPQVGTWTGSQTYSVAQA